MQAQNIPDHVADELSIAERLIRLVTDRATGRSSNGCNGELPRTAYFIGSLRPVPLEEETERWLADLADKLSPVAMGLDILVDLKDMRTFDIPVQASWAVYYRVKPTLDEQREYQNPTRATDPDSQDTDADPVQQPAQNTREVPKPVFRKIECKVDAQISVWGSTDSMTLLVSELQNAITAELFRASAVAEDDPDNLRVNPGARRQGQEGKPNRIDSADTLNQSTYDQYWSALPEAVQPHWAIRIDGELRAPVEEGGAHVLSISLVNTTPISQRDEVHEPFLFDATLSLELPPGIIRPFHLTSAPKDFRENPEMFGRGRNCAVERTNDRVSTTHTPMYW